MSLWLISYAGFSGTDMRVGATLVPGRDHPSAVAAGAQAAAEHLMGSHVDRIEILGATKWPLSVTLGAADGHRYLVSLTLVRVL